MDNLNKLHLNKRATTGSNVLKAVGSEEALNRCADLWEKANDDMALIGAHELVSFCETYQFDHRELDAFKLGLSAIPNFLAECKRQKDANSIKKD